MCEHDDFKREGEKCEICPDETTGNKSASVMGSTACDLISNKLKSLRERRDYELKSQDYYKLIQLDAQIFILENMWPDFMRLEKP